MIDEQLSEDERFMRQALTEARKAFEQGEVPVGAVVVWNGRIVGRGHNLVETLSDATAHAEMQAITAAASSVGGKYPGRMQALCDRRAVRDVCRGMFLEPVGRCRLRGVRPQTGRRTAIALAVPPEDSGPGKRSARRVRGTDDSLFCAAEDIGGVLRALRKVGHPAAEELFRRPF